MAARSILQLFHAETDGDVLASKTITVTKPDGSALGVSIYEQVSGGAPVVSPETSSVGTKLLYAEYADLDAAAVGRVKVSYSDSPATTFDDAFWPDPLDLFVDGMTRDRTLAGALTVADALTVTGGATVSLATADSYALNVQHTLAGGTGNKLVKVLDDAGNVIWETASLGSGPDTAMIGTYFDTDNGVITIGNTRNWNANSDVVVSVTRVGLDATDSHAPVQVTYVAASYPDASVVDEVCANFDFFAINTASDLAAGITQDYSGSGRAIELQVLEWESANLGTMAGATVGMHSANVKISNIDSALGGGAATSEYGNCGFVIHTSSQDGLWTGWGTTQRSNTGCLVVGEPGWQQGYGYLDTDLSLLWCVDKFGDTYSGDMYPRPGGSFTLGSAARQWTQAYAGTFISANGSAAAPAYVVLGSGASNDGLFGVVAGSVVGFSVAGTERGRFDATAFQIAQGERLTGVISPTQLAANTDNWNPTGLSTARVIRASSDASRNLTGIVAQTAGTVLSICNVGAQDIVLVHGSTSTAENQFVLAGSANLTLTPNKAITLWYDGTVARWRALTA